MFLPSNSNSYAKYNGIFIPPDSLYISNCSLINSSSKYISKNLADRYSDYLILYCKILR